MSDELFQDLKQAIFNLVGMRDMRVSQAKELMEMIEVRGRIPDPKPPQRAMGF